MSYGIRIHVWGDYACFTRPEMKAERVSYDVMTPSAARGVIEAIYWKPQIRWVIDRIHVLRPIQFTSIRRNEIGNKMGKPSSAAMKGSPVAPMGVAIEEDRQQRASLILRDVSYLIEAHFDILDHRFARGGSELPHNDCAGKHLDMFNRRACKGQYFHHPYLGTREFPASFALIEEDATLPESTLSPAQANKDLGYMLYDIAFDVAKKTGELKSATPQFFRAELKDGILHCAHPQTVA